MFYLNCVLHNYFYVCCSDCGNVCCVAAVVKDSVFLALECCCMFV